MLRSAACRQCPAALLLLMQVVLVGKMSDYQLHSSHHSFCLHDGTGGIDVSRFDNDATEAPDAWEAVPVSFDEGGCA